MNKPVIILSILTTALANLLFSGGCRNQARLPESRDDCIQLSQQIKRCLAGYSTQGRPVEMITAGQGKEAMLIIATIHGNEWAGTPLVEELVRHLRTNPDTLSDRQVIIMPLANPDGKAANIRGNGAKVDINRNFDAPNRVNNARNGEVPLSQPESRLIQQVILIKKPQRILVIHAPLNCVDFDGPGRALAEEISKTSGLAVNKLGGLPGSLGSYAGGQLGIPIITLELPPAQEKLSPAALWDKYGPALLAFITFSDSTPHQ